MLAEILLSLASDLMTGPNIPFVGSFALALLFTLLSVIGAGQADADADAEVSAEADVGHDVDIDHDVDVDVETEVGFDHDVDVDVDPEVDLAHDVDMDVDTEVDLAHDVDVDPEVEVDAGVDHDVEADVGDDLDLDHAADVDAEHDADFDAASSVTLNDILLFFGVGRVPLSILLMAFSYAFAVTGWMLNTLFAGPDGQVGAWFSASLAGAGVVGLAAMRLVSSVIVHFLPTTNVSGVARRQLVGLRGVVGLPVDEKTGRATVTDREGTLHQVRCRVRPGGKRLPKGSKIILVKYVAEDDLYYVAADRRR